MRFAQSILLPLFCIALLLPSQSLVLAVEQNGKKVSFEIYTTERASPQTAKVWFEILSKLGVTGIQVRGGKAADKPVIEEQKLAGTVTFKIRAELNNKGELIVPGAKFTRNDATAINEWMGTLSAHGAEGVTEKKQAYGLTERQLVEVQKDLGVVVKLSTKGKKSFDVLKAMVADSKLAVAIDSSIEKAMTADEPVRDELQGMSRGTALAALLRPTGAVLVPRKPANKEVEFWITGGKNAPQSWPVGWTSDERLDKQAPKLLDSLNAEIDGVSAAEVIDAVRQRVELPLFMDHNMLALKDVDLSKPVKLPAGKTYYYRLLRDVLDKMKCNYEVRVDENNRPFLWITTKQ